MPAIRYDSLALILLAAVGIVYLLITVVPIWHHYSRLLKITHVITLFALIANIVVHCFRFAGVSLENGWYTTVVVFLITAIDAKIIENYYRAHPRRK